ncbi:MAG: hypothetical protein LRY27_00040 [Chitinophagales bacterium]|nr:hypothetical protein [Chitinophagales bacterium]
MKNIILFLVILLFIPVCHAQELTCQNLSLTNPDLKILYVGVDNYLEFKGFENVENVRFESKHSKINYTNQEENSFVLYVSTYKYKVQLDTFIVYQDNKEIGNFIFEIKLIGDPIVQLGSIDSTYATIYNIIANPELNVVIKDCFLEHHFHVVSFEVFTVIHNETKALYPPFEPGIMDTITLLDPITFRLENKITILERTEAETYNLGWELSNYQIEQIKTLSKGNQLIFDNIKVQSPDGVTRKLPALVITII